ncbi:hypothetical protein ABH922_002171 [Rhodococcus sp. 27YEA15]
MVKRHATAILDRVRLLTFVRKMARYSKFDKSMRPMTVRDSFIVSEDLNLFSPFVLTRKGRGAHVGSTGPLTAPVCKFSKRNQ